MDLADVLHLFTRKTEKYPGNRFLTVAAQYGSFDGEVFAEPGLAIGERLGVIQVMT